MWVKILFFLCLFSIIPGPLAALPLGVSGVNVYLTDVLAGILLVYHLIRLKKTLRIIKSDVAAFCFLGFASLGFISLLLSPLHINSAEKIISSFYLIRLLGYFSFYLTLKELLHKKSITREAVFNLLIIIGLIVAALGWLQYFLYPDLRNLYYLGWDPHFKRIFSTFLDPNYLGLILSLTFITIYFKNREKLNSWRILALLFVFVTLMFTYSRSSFLSFFAAAVYFFFKKKKYHLLFVLVILMLVSMVLLPRPGGVGVKLERIFSAETRVENWRQAIKVFTDHPVLGVGYDTIRFAKREYNFGQDNLDVNHAGAGFDNSFLFITATTGIAGLMAYLLFLGRFFIRGNLWIRTSLIAIIIHSLFLNSLFFPWVMLWMWTILAL